MNFIIATIVMILAIVIGPFVLAVVVIWYSFDIILFLCSVIFTDTWNFIWDHRIELKITMMILLAVISIVGANGSTSSCVTRYKNGRVQNFNRGPVRKTRNNNAKDFPDHL